MASFYKHPERARRKETLHNIPFKKTWKNLLLIQVGAVGAGKAKTFENDLYDYVNISIVSNSFLREQIRRMMSVITAYGYGRMDKSTIKYLLERPKPSNFFDMDIPVAPPQGLFLTDVVYDPSLYMRPIPYFNNELNSAELDDKL
uniref:tRNA pseudouridine synthase n=1 Tax=Strongyloides papillosus TaxID=174720 RepID=A0A0N5BI59_STREA